MHPIADSLLQWYDASRRDLPWRRHPDPYRIWIAEVMLQQTRVETVIPYYERWLAQFPSLAALAAAHEDQVLQAWAGMGYYSRARNLHMAVREVAARYGGEVPRETRAFAALPGVGEYTAGAVMSMAYGQAVPAVDGNVLRVVARLTCLKADVGRPATRRRVGEVVSGWIPGERAGDFNQALMELGARVCLPRRPRCEQCPLREWCAGLARGEAAPLPVKGAKAPPRPVQVVVGVVTDGGQVLCTRRPERGLLAGMWEFPGGEFRPGEPAGAALRSLLWQQWRIEVEVGPELACAQHAFSHRVWHLTAFHCGLALTSPRPAGQARLRWLRPGELGSISLPAAYRSVAAAVQAMVL